MSKKVFPTDNLYTPQLPPNYLSVVVKQKKDIRFGDFYWTLKCVY